MVQQQATNSTHLPPPEADVLNLGWVQPGRWGTGTDGNVGVQENILPLTGQQHLLRKGEPLSTSGTAQV